MDAYSYFLDGCFGVGVGGDCIFGGEEGDEGEGGGGEGGEICGCSVSPPFCCLRKSFVRWGVFFFEKYRPFYTRLGALLRQM